MDDEKRGLAAGASGVVRSAIRRFSAALPTGSPAPRRPSDPTAARDATAHPAPLAATTKPHDHRENTPLHGTSPSDCYDSADGAALRDTFIRPDTAASDVDVEAVFSRLSGTVVLLGGYRGSVLRDAVDGRRLWVPLKVGLNWREVDLQLGLADDDELRAAETVRADKMLTAVASFIDLGKSLKQRLKDLDAAGAITFINHGYDWRLSLDLSSAELLAKLEDIKRMTGEGATVIAHSMGGLVSLHALARASDPSVFKRLICAGTPWRGCQNVLGVSEPSPYYMTSPGPLRRGDPVLRNRTICSPQAVFSMRSSFCALVEDRKMLCFVLRGRASSLCSNLTLPVLLAPNMPLFELPDGSPVPINWQSVEQWSRHALSPVTDGVLDRREGAADELARIEARASAAEASGEADEMGLPIAPTLTPTDSTLAQSGSPTQIRPNKSSSLLATALRPLRERLTPDKPPSAAAVADATRAPSDAEVVDYLERTLARSSRFWTELTDLHDARKTYPPIVLITSDATATVRGALVDKADEVRTVDFSRLLYAEGDGIVLHSSSSSMPAPWQPRSIVSSRHGHVSLLGDLSAVAQALEA